MKIASTIEIALLPVVVLCAALLIQDVRALRAATASQLDIAHSNDRILFSGTAAGVNVSGELMYDHVPVATKRIAVFCLRADSLDADVRTWTSVAEALGKEATVHLVGYCDGDVCAEAVRRVNGPLPFTVLAYGEAAPTQAVVNADAHGAFILLNERQIQLRRVAWRTPMQSGAAIAREALR